jgi:hypothetical protein
MMVAINISLAVLIGFVVLSTMRACTKSSSTNEGTDTMILKGGVER